MKKDVMKAIREKCLDCCCGQPGEVRLCPLERCPLWKFRMGKALEEEKEKEEKK